MAEKIQSLAKPSLRVKYALFCQFYIKIDSDQTGTDGKPVIFMVHENHKFMGYFYVHLLETTRDT